MPKAIASDGEQTKRQIPRTIPMFAVGRLTLSIIGNPFLVTSNFFPPRPSRTDRRGRARLAVQRHARRGTSLSLHVVRLVAPQLHTPCPLPPPARRALPICHSVHCDAHKFTFSSPSLLPHRARDTHCRCHSDAAGKAMPSGCSPTSPCARSTCSRSAAPLARRAQVVPQDLSQKKPRFI